MRCPAESRARPRKGERLARLAALGCAIATISACATANRSADFEKAPLYGIVFDESRGPVQWVTVTLGATDAVQTDVDGRFCFSDVGRGPISITATADGYEHYAGVHEFTSRTQVISIRLRSAGSFVTAAIEALRVGDFEEAARLAERSLAIDPAGPTALYVAALAAYHKGDRDAGLEFLASIAGTAGYRAVGLLERDLDRLEARSR